jgi:hypothetical protein
MTISTSSREILNPLTGILNNPIDSKAQKIMKNLRKNLNGKSKEKKKLYHPRKINTIR